MSSELNPDAYLPASEGFVPPPMDERHHREIVWVSQGYRVPDTAARQYLAVCGGTAEAVSRALVAACDTAPTFYDTLPVRYPLDLIVAAGSAETGREWAAERIHPMELHKKDRRTGVFEPDTSPMWSDVLDMVRGVPSDLNVRDVVRLIRGCEWDGLFPVENAVTALRADLSWDYLFAMDLS